ncbi:MAG: DUF748 domain-containing protein [Elusimicrobia bacterium]|nr:DUF748 domain-containing protein [Elusimicrobiota bacterium]
MKRPDVDWGGEKARRWKRRALWIAGLYAAFAAVSWKAVPWATRKAFAGVPEALPGFSLGAGAVSFNPFTLRLRVDGLSLRHRTLGELASCREVRVALNPFAAFRLALGLREIKLTDPKLVLVVAADGTSVLDALPKSSGTAAKPSGPPFIPRVVIGDFEVSGGALEFESLLPSAPQKVLMRPIDFSLRNLSTIPEDGGRYDLQAGTNRGERLLWDGTLTVRPPRLSGRIAFDNVDLTRVSTAVPTSPVLFDAGRLSVSSGYEISLDSGVLTASLKDARTTVSGLLWRLKAAPERKPRGPFSIDVGPAQVRVTASALGSPQGKVTLRADVPVQTTARVRLSAYVAPKPLAGGADVDVESLPLAIFSPLAPPPTRLSLDDGSLSLRSRTEYSARGVSEDASLSVSNFKLSGGPGRGVLAGFRRFAVESAELSTRRRALSIAAVRLEGPFLRLARDKRGAINVAEAAGVSLSSAAPSASEAPRAAPKPGRGPSRPAWKVRLGRLSVSGGRILVQDDAVAPPFALNVSDARADLTGLADDSRSTAAFSASAEIEKAPVSVRGRIRLSTSAAWGEAKIAGKAIQLPLFSAYSGKYAGYKIDKGSFGFDLDHKIAGREISTQNRVVVDQMTFGGKVESPDAVKIPVKLALAVLKDRNGVIDLSVPVDGSLDDPKFHVFGAVLKTLGGLVVKAALSPFSALGAMVGAKGDLGQVAFEPGRADLSAAVQAQLDAVAKILADKPEMLIGVRGSATRVDALARGDRELLRRLRGKSAGGEPLTPREESRLAALHRQILGADAASPAQARADLDAKWEANDAEMRTLALARADAIKAALAARGVAAARFFSLEPVAGASLADEPTRLQLDVR